MILNKKISWVLVLLFPICLQAQWGGKNVYSFLSLPVSPREAALGGSAIAINDNDLSIVMSNPSLLNEKVNGKFLVEYVHYLADINFGRVAYAHKFDKIGTLALGIQYLNGGNFIHTDLSGNKYGNFSANEMAISVSYKKNLDSSLVLGASLKPVFSQLYHYHSFGIAMDAALSYTLKNKRTTATLLLKNIGSQISTYNRKYEPIPFDIQLGIATKLAHAPFRISVVAHSLNRLKMVHRNTNQLQEQEIDSKQKSNLIAQHIFRHFLLGIEFIPVKSFFVRVGFNYQIRQELKLENKAGFAGISWGFGFRISKFHFSYANVRYHPAGLSNQFAITTNLSDFMK